jgi:voltage-gated potassium channel Kch
MFDIEDPVTKRFLSAATMVLVVYCVAVPFFMVVEHLTLVDSIYFTTASMTSVGYGDITPHTVIGKLFTVALLLTAVSIFFYHITHFGQFREQAIDPHVRKRLQMLRNLTSLQTGEVQKEQLKRIRRKMGGKAK